MKITTRPMVAFLMFAVLLAMAVFGAGGSVFAKGIDPAPARQGAGFRWQIEAQLASDPASAPAEAVLPLKNDGVRATVSDKQLVMDGQQGVGQMRTALFDTAAPWMDFLGGPVELVLYLPADGTDVTLNLEARIASGYRWEIVPETGALYTESAKPAFTMRYQGYGAPAIQAIQLKATGKGNTTVRLAYRRPFGPEEPVHARLNVWMPVAAGLELSDPTPVAPAQDGDASLSSTEEPDPLAELLPKSLPPSWNWRAQGILTPIRDQGGCGSCWAFATVGAMEAAIMKSGGPSTNLSEQFLVSCNEKGWSCNGGWDSHAYHYKLLGKNQTLPGAVLESAKPYTATDGSCNVPLDHPYRLSGWGYVGGLNSGNYWHSVPTYTQLKNAIYTYGPITAGVCDGSAFSNYSGGLFTTDEASLCYDPQYGYYSPNHMIVLVGWDDADQSLILRNSWNTWWGRGGYMRIKYGTSMVGIAPTWVKRTLSLAAPTLIAPGGAIHTRKPAYTWSKVGVAASYQLQVYDIAAAAYRVNMTVSASFCNAATKRCSYTPNILLANNRYYNWRAADTGGAWSAWKTFKPIP